ncbi:MAG TPA: 3-dehydroquinate synthase [Bryobacteraceae bacterium]|jgi:3-dehydroquinate synthase
MPSFGISTPQGNYSAVVERGLLRSVGRYLPAGKAKIFVVTTEDVWQFVGPALTAGFEGRPFERILLPGGEENKRLAPVEAAAEEMIRLGGDRSSLVVAVGGGIVTDMGGFLAAIFMRGIPVIQIPTTLLAQVDAAIGGKTGTNLVSGKNLIGSFHQPLAVLIDPGVLDTLPEREYRAGLYEVIKHGIIRSPGLFQLFEQRRDDVLAMESSAVEMMIVESVRIKADVVSNDERESGLRKILNFGHTFGHALEAETGYSHFLHGEAVAWGMKAAAWLGNMRGMIDDGVRERMLRCIEAYGPIPSLAGIPAANLHARLAADKKTVQSKVHFVLPTRIGEVVVVNDVPSEQSLQAIERALR